MQDHSIDCRAQAFKVHLCASMCKYYFRVDPRIWDFSLVKPKNNRKQASLERIPKFLGKPSKSCAHKRRRNDDNFYPQIRVGGGEESFLPTLSFTGMIQRDVRYVVLACGNQTLVILLIYLYYLILLISIIWFMISIRWDNIDDKLYHKVGISTPSRRHLVAISPTNTRNNISRLAQEFWNSLQ